MAVLRSAADFDQALGIQPDLTPDLVVWGWWRIVERERKETISIHSALVSPSSTHALLCALQTTLNPHDYRIPDERDELEIDQPGFQLCGWIALPRSRSGLDQFDPFAGILWPGPVPGRRVRHVLRLSADNEGRTWHCSGSPVLQLRIWGDQRDDKYRSPGNYGNRLTTDVKFLLAMLRQAGRDMIIEVGIERDNGQEKDETVPYAYRRYTRLYLLQGDGQLETLHGCRRVRPEADR